MTYSARMHDADELPPALRRYVPLLLAVLVVAALAYIPLKITGLGFVPPDDALRHVGKALSGKAWSEILVMRPDITIDHNHGWHVILATAHRALGWDADALMTFSLTSLALLFLLVPLLWARRLEAWPLALLAVVVCFPHYPFRLMLGRPYILAVTAFMVVLALWQRAGYRPGRGLLALTVSLIALATWTHGGWYQYMLPAAALLGARQWKAGLQMLACWLLGSFLGAALTGHPFTFLMQQVMVLVSCFGHHSLQRMLVTEFQPHEGQYTLVALLAAVALVRAWRGRPVLDLLREPVFMLAVGTWILGFQMQRFWLDWGIPATLVWLTREFGEYLEGKLPADSLNRVVVTGAACAALALGASSDLGGRWTKNLTREYLSPETPGIADWLPAPGGILYSASQPVFYETFFRNPQAPWRYVLGYEATFMTAENLDILRRIQWNFGAWEAYQPWADGLTPADRLVMRRPAGDRPALPQLEWRYVAAETWIGRLPRSDAPIRATAAP